MNEAIQFLLEGATEPSYRGALAAQEYAGLRDSAAALKLLAPDGTTIRRDGGARLPNGAGIWLFSGKDLHEKMAGIELHRLAFVGSFSQEQIIRAGSRVRHGDMRIERFW